MKAYLSILLLSWWIVLFPSLSEAWVIGDGRLAASKRVIARTSSRKPSARRIREDRPGRHHAMPIDVEHPSAAAAAVGIPLPTAEGVIAARGRIASHVVRTPLLESPLINEQFGGGTRILVKAECLQHTGSFKYRGALHRLMRLQETDPDAARRGVVAFSSGNFGQALAAAATSLAIDCTIVSPHDAPPIKLDRIRKYGAQLVLSEAPPTENREVVASAKAVEISRQEGRTLLHPFEDVDVVQGQGTTGLELIEQADEILSGSDDTLGSIIVPCGGGGLTAGICLAVEAYGRSNEINMMSVEPSGYDDHAQSFASAGRKRLSLAELYPATADTSNRSLECDALMAGAPGETTWKINSPRLSDALASPGDESAIRAMKVAFEHYRLVLEPSGALAMAAVLDGQVDLEEGKVVVVVASGGNTDLDTFTRLMESI